MRETRSGRGTMIAALVLLAAAQGGCASTTSIGDLMDDPHRYDGETVRVEGEVTASLGLPGPGLYRLDDGTGSLPVVSERGGAPRSGARVAVEGEFRAAFTVGTETLAVLVEEERSEP